MVMTPADTSTTVPRAQFGFSGCAGGGPGLRAFGFGSRICTFAATSGLLPATVKIATFSPRCSARKFVPQAFTWLKYSNRVASVTSKVIGLAFLAFGWTVTVPTLLVSALVRSTMTPTRLGAGDGVGAAPLPFTA